MALLVGGATSCSPRTQRALQLSQRRRANLSSARAACCTASASPFVSVKAAHGALLHEGAFCVDVRSARDFDREHLTKPPKMNHGVAWTGEADAEKWTSAAAKALGLAAKRGKVLIMSAEGGEEAEAAARALQAAGFVSVDVIAGGWTEWRKSYTSTLRDTPPAGRWIPTGQEALKSGLMSGDAAMSYEGAWHRWIRVAYPLLSDNAPSNRSSPSERINVENLTKQ